MRPQIAIAVLLALLASASLPASAADAAHGKTLYQSYCISCHDSPPQGGAATAPGNPSRIANAINTIPDMGVLRGLFTSADLADIAAYIAVALSAPPPAVVPAFDYTDLWWNPLESGWGFNLIQHPLTTNNIFGVMYIYDDAGHPTWYILPGGTWVTPTTFTGVWASVSGTTPNQAYKFNAPTAVGTGTIEFFDRNNARLTFTVNGRTIVKTMQVLVF
jgi:cytochrome c553